MPFLPPPPLPGSGVPCRLGPAAPAGERALTGPGHPGPRRLRLAPDARAVGLPDNGASRRAGDGAHGAQPAGRPPPGHALRPGASGRGRGEGCRPACDDRALPSGPGRRVSALLNAGHQGTAVFGTEIEDASARIRAAGNPDGPDAMDNPRRAGAIPVSAVIGTPHSCPRKGDVRPSADVGTRAPGRGRRGTVPGPGSPVLDLAAANADGVTGAVKGPHRDPSGCTCTGIGFRTAVVAALAAQGRKPPFTSPECHPRASRPA